MCHQSIPGLFYSWFSLTQVSRREKFIAELRRAEHHGYDFFRKSTHARNLGYDVTYVRPPSARTDCRGGGGEAGEPLGTGVFGQFSLEGNRVAALHLATRVFLAGNHIGHEQRDKE